MKVHHRDRSRARRIIVVLLALLLLAGCVSRGPEAIQGTRTDHNIALRKSEDQQLLLNLVRLRYRDQVLFLEPTALTTQFSFGASASAGTRLGSGSGSYDVGGSIVAEENPTVSYAPLKGGDFVERVLSPVPLDTLFLLDTSGWSSERAFRVLVEQMNGVKNAPRANGPTPKMAPEFEDFIRVTKLLRELELDEQVYGASSDEGPLLVFDDEARERPEYLALTELLDLDPALGQYRIASLAGSRSPDDRTLNISIRSFAGIMYFLSQAVEAPERDVAAGRVTLTRDAAGRPFDWLRVTDGLMQIRSSDERPDNAATAVYYRDSWFYIDDADLDSKSTFSMLGQVFALQSGEIETVRPVLTLPVAR